MFRTALAALTACAALSLTTPAAADDMDWRKATHILEGCWEGTGLGGDVAECWIVADDGRADGMFLMRRDGQPAFAEIITIDDFGDGPEMRLKHVHADMTGWEEKDEYVSFRFLSAGPERLTFKGVVLRFDGADIMNTELKMEMKDGEVRTMPFNFTRTASVTRVNPSPGTLDQ